MKENKISTPKAAEKRHTVHRIHRAKASAAPQASERPAAQMAPEKLKLLVLVVNRSKAEFFIDLLSAFDINMQLSTLAWGTASTEMLSLLGLADSEKELIMGVIREDKEKQALEALDEKFKTIKNGKGIAYTISLTSVIGVALFKFLSNTKD